LTLHRVLHAPHRAAMQLLRPSAQVLSAPSPYPHVLARISRATRLCAGGWRQDVPRILPLPVEDAKKKSSKNGKDEEAPPPPEVGVFVDGPLTYASMGGLRSRVILRESG